MTTRTLRIEVRGTTLTVDGEQSGAMRRLGVFQLSELQNVFVKYGEPNETHNEDGRYVMIWRLDPSSIDLGRSKKELANGSGAFRPMSEDD